MPIPFLQEDYIILEDVEDCPYPFSSPSYNYWWNDDSIRLLLIALDRYADELQKKKNNST